MTLRSEHLTRILTGLALFSLVLFGAVPGMARDVSSQVDRFRGAGVDQDLLNRVLALGVDHCLGPDFMTRVLEILEAAAEENIPGEPFVDKFEEGLAKQVMPARIGNALMDKLDDYRYAQELVVNIIRPRPGTFKPQDLIPLGESLDLGLSPEALKNFLENAPSSSLSMLLIGVEALALLHQIDFDHVLSTTFIFQGLERGVLTERWQSLPEAVVLARSKGLSDAAIATIIQDVIDREGSIDIVWKKLAAASE